MKCIILCLASFLISSQLYPSQEQELITLFAHGLGTSKYQILHYIPDVFLTPTRSFDFPEAQGKLTGVGHGPDLTCLEQQIHPEIKYIGFGFSRGGAALLKYIATHNPPNMQALIIESAPADVVDLVRHFFITNFGVDLLPLRQVHEIIFNYLFPGYPLYSTPAIESLNNMTNKNLPILILHSKTDRRVPISSAWSLYKALRQAGCPSVYLYEIEEADHGLMFHQDAVKIMQLRHGKHITASSVYHQQQTALRALHNFYKMHGFAYNQELCAYQHESEQVPFTIEDMQPSLSAIEEKLIAQEQKNIQNHHNCIRTLTIAAAVTYFFNHWYIDNKINIA